MIPLAGQLQGRDFRAWGGKGFDEALARINAQPARASLRLVLEWEGPFEFTGTTLNQRRKLALLPGAAPADSGVADFVQDRRTGEVLQALLRSYC